VIRIPVRKLIAAVFVIGMLAPVGAASAARDPSSSVSKLAPTLLRRIEREPLAGVVTWVFFSDRAGSERDPAAYVAASRLLSARSLERRARRGSIPGIIASDLPVHEAYVHALVARGARLRGTSRWLNAASVEIPPALAREIAALPFVSRIELVPTGRSIDPIEAPEPIAPSRGALDGAAAPDAIGAPVQIALAPGDTAYYGASFKQLSMMQVPQLHAMGLTGAGVLVCMLDSGFRTTHPAFASLNVLAKRDFIHGDTNVDFDPTQDQVGQQSHGTWTLGCVAGSKPGTYSGGAFGATVALGKTEEVSSERPVEMDYWQFGAEWADSLGADVISSSLGYSVFDAPYPSYTYADMDGKTTVVTLAALEAARRGITVVNAAGNEGNNAWHYLIAPADADTIIASGAVDSFNVVTGFSSRGPTSDGRIKPDCTAMGRGVFLPASDSTSNYIRASGTSFSTPLTAGLVALLLEAHPAWRPFEVREALRETALNHASPNNDIGWGLVQGLAAKAWIPSTTAVRDPAGRVSGIEISAGPNPIRARGETTIRFTTPPGLRARVEIVDLAGRRRASLFEGSAAGTKTLRWNGVGDDGLGLAAGIYWVRVTVHGARPAGEERSESRATRVVLLP